MKRVPTVLLLWGLAGLCSAEQCPQSQQKCATGMTCCLLPSGQQGCCPYANATCCADQVHCCPMGSECNSSGVGHSCRKTHEFTIVQDHALKLKNSCPGCITSASQIMGSVKMVCGDGSQCPDQSTCCPLNDSEFGCCPMASAVCCGDKRHCCPQSTQCDEAGYCKKTNFVESIRAKKVNKAAVKEVCPGESGAECPDESTCCAAGQGEWGCCPLNNAVCCPDQQTCCPTGYRCTNDPDQPGCIQQD